MNSQTTLANPTVIDAAELHERLEGPNAPRVLDVRTPAEFESAHIPGSYNVPLDLLREHRSDLAERLGPDAQETVLVCRSGARATQAEQALATTALPGLRVLNGGMNGWESTGAPVNRGRQTWELERQVRLVAGTAVAASVLASTVSPRLKWVAAAVGSGLSVAAVTNTCAMGVALSKMPWNRGASEVGIDEVLGSLGANG